MTRFTSLVSELLALSGIQSGRLDFEEEGFDFSALAQKTVDTLLQTTQSQ
jgi:hypothetical protein